MGPAPDGPKPSASREPNATDEAASFPHTVLQCLVFAARRREVDLSVGRIVHEEALENRELSLEELASIARVYGFKAKVAKLDWRRLSQLDQAFPAPATLTNGNGVVILGAAEKDGMRQVAVVDPLADRPGVIQLPFEEFQARWSGRVLLLKHRAARAKEAGGFGLSWFLPEMTRQRRLFVDVILASLALPLVSLAVPMFFQLVIDKVMVHQSLSTLYVLTIGVLAALLFEAGFGFLRQFFLLFASRRIDIRIARRTFAHLLSLPMDFFEKRYAGVLTKHMQQTDRIRRFLTGRLLLTMLDLVVLVVMLPVLVLYSAKLTLLVLGFAALIAMVIGALIGPFRRRLRELYTAEADRQALLVESIHGVNTIKSLALEPKQKRRWDDKAAEAVERHFRVGVISATAQSLTKLLQRLMVVAVIAVGAFDVIAGAMSVGALVAFQMISGRVTGPLVAIVSLIHEYQETALSVRMLGEVMNAKPERPPLSAGLRGEIKGGISFEQVSFSYAGASLPALAGLDLDIPAGTLLGVVGRSGSGKSTMARLIQGLYTPQQGMVRIDGVDLREIDIHHLRRNVGVVLQDNFLFRGTIRDNIAITKPDASMDQIAWAARMAGADEFVARLPQGFDTFLEEGGVNLSGGQKQRLAVARALLIQPRILLLDEATSALDPESEAIIRQSLKTIAQKRTVVLISHRLTNLIDAHKIAVLDQGKLVGLGTHSELLTDCSVYARLWERQMGGAETGAGS